jgi:hypothetical protein
VIVPTPRVRSSQIGFFVSIVSYSSSLPGRRSMKAVTASLKPRGRSSRRPPTRM